jgi:cellulose synthase/poly-beta-1,6-N-acetylglucosamine synthase-like glycosyltransferase
VFILLALSFLLSIFYVSIMWAYKNEWEETEETHLLSESCSTSVTVIIPARNEARNIRHLLEDITQQLYPADLTEIIIIDDFSEDDTFAICKQYAAKFDHLKVFRLEEILPGNDPSSAYKKKAIEAAVQMAKGKLIITTDADCRLQKHWIHSIVSFYEKEKCALIAAPVGYYKENTRFQHFQALDFCGMQAITAAMIRMEIFNMANGANLAYERQAFLDVNGYKDIDHKASGDDMLLVYKIAKRYPDKIRFLKNKASIVLTEPMHSLKDFLQQRFRWTSKSASYQDKRITIILGLVYLFVCSIWLNAFLFIGNIFYSFFFADHTIIAFLRFLPVFLYLLMLIFQLMCKTIIDYQFLRSSSAFFNRHDLMKTFPTSELLHIWYIPFVGTFGNILKYSWKGRKLK